MDKAGGIVAVMGGVVLLYLAYTGYLGSAWAGIKGECGKSTEPKKESAAAGEAGHYSVTPTGALLYSEAGILG